MLRLDQQSLFKFQELVNAFQNPDDQPVVIEIPASTVIDDVNLFYELLHAGWLIIRSHISYV